MNTNLNPDRVDDLFYLAADLPPDERAAFLSNACDGDDHLLRAVQELLAADEQLEQEPEFLESGPEERRTGDNSNEKGHSDDPLIGKHIGPYEVKRRLGEGGFGAVYLATRTKDFRQKVAIKVVMDHVKNLPRFEQERQLLADLQHEHIARLLDGGTLVDGRPYIVMELIDGQTITQFSDDNRLPVNARLALFRQVCGAVAFAHRYGVIHRDIKPLNILVNQQGFVKLLDFGIAKLLDTPTRQALVSTEQRSTLNEVSDRDTVSFAFDSSSVAESGTEVGAIGPMSPAYASPEQARGKELSTASDIYSLGVVLYELLTGHRPYYFQALTLEEVRRVICDSEPLKPSSLVANPSELTIPSHNDRECTPAELADLRGTTSKVLEKTLRGDLDAIVLYALQKEPAHRYQTVEHLAQELGKFAQNLPVDARPISRRERAVRWVRRNKLVAALLVAIVLALFGGTLASTLFAIDARQQYAAALAAKKTAEAKESETAAVLEFVEKRVFAAARPEGQQGGLGRNVKLRDAVEAALPYVDAGFSDHPVIEARLRGTLGVSFFYLGDDKTATELFERSRALCIEELGQDHPISLWTAGYLASTYAASGRNDDAIRLLEDTLVLQKRVLGDGHPNTLESMNSLASRYDEVGRRTDALKMLERALEIGKAASGFEQHIDTLLIKAKICHYMGDHHGSFQIMEEVLERQNAELGLAHPDTLWSMEKQAYNYVALGRLQEAFELYTETLRLMKPALGADHPITQLCMRNLATTNASLGYFDKALSLYEEVLAMQDAKLGPDDPDKLKTMELLAKCNAKKGDYGAAVQWSERAFKLLGDNGDSDQRNRVEQLLAYYQTMKAMREKNSHATGETPQLSPSDNQPM